MDLDGLITWASHMEAPINLEESFGKVVGRRTSLRNPFQAGMRLQALAEEMHKTFDHHWTARGVYRFKTHEEADEWMWKMLARSRAPKT